MKGDLREDAKEEGNRADQVDHGGHWEAACCLNLPDGVCVVWNCVHQDCEDCDANDKVDAVENVGKALLWSRNLGFRCSLKTDNFNERYNLNNEQTLSTGLGVEIGKMEDIRQCVSFGPRLQVLKSSSAHDFATKVMAVMQVKGTGMRKTVWYPSITAFTTKIIKDMAKLKA